MKSKGVQVGDDINIMLSAGMQAIPVKVVQVGNETTPWVVVDIDGSVVQFTTYIYLVKPSDKAMKKGEERAAIIQAKKLEEEKAAEKRGREMTTPNSQMKVENEPVVN